MEKEREKQVYLARLAEQAERYDEMVEAMKAIAKMDVELTVEEREERNGEGKRKTGLLG